MEGSRSGPVEISTAPDPGFQKKFAAKEIASLLYLQFFQVGSSVRAAGWCIRFPPSTPLHQKGNLKKKDP